MRALARIDAIDLDMFCARPCDPKPGSARLLELEFIRRAVRAMELFAGAQVRLTWLARAVREHGTHRHALTRSGARQCGQTLRYV